MRRLSGFLALSGLVWLGGLIGLDALDGGPQAWPTTLATWAAPVIAVGTLVTFLTKTMRQAAVSLAILWLLTVAVALVLLSAAFGASLLTANVALLYVSIPYTAWLVFPLVVTAYLRDGERRRSGDVRSGQ
jgi:hypothetical protein